MKTSPTQRTLKLLRFEGWTCAIVEHYNPWCRIRQDLFGWIDIVAMKEGVTGLLGVQTTTTDNLAARQAKADALPAYHLWLACGNRAEFIGWSKMGKRDKRKLWTATRRLTLPVARPSLLPYPSSSGSGRTRIPLSSDCAVLPQPALCGALPAQPESPSPHDVFP